MRKAKALIYIKSDITEKIKINDNVSIYPLFEQERQKIITEYEFIDDKHDFYTDIKEANYCLEIKIDSNAELLSEMQILSQTLRLISKGSSGNVLEIYPEGAININLFASKINNVLGITEINKNDIDKFQTILSKIKKNRILKLALMINHYLAATSGYNRSLSSSFIEFFTVLEMIYLDENERYGLETKLKNRINDAIGMDLSYYYTTRSKLVHTGYLKKGNERDGIENLSNAEFEKAFSDLAEIVRKSILKEMENSKYFTETKYPRKNFSIEGNKNE